MATVFNYNEAFSRNHGWVTEAEQQKLKGACVAIAGLGGVGGSHALTLARLGVTRFRLADFDVFELPNFNRQAGAMMSTLNKPKCSVVAAMVRDINPEAEVMEFPTGINEGNIRQFMEGASVYVDSIDFFAMDARKLVFREAHKLGVPALTAAPLGMGVAFLHFSPKGMSFDEYFQFEGHSELGQLARFLAGLSPAMLQRNYLAVPEAVDFAKGKGPSTRMGIDLCAGVMGVETLKVILKRGELKAAPWGYQFDPYLQQFKKTYRPFGNANPVQRALIKIIKTKLIQKSKTKVKTAEVSQPSSP